MAKTSYKQMSEFLNGNGTGNISNVETGTKYWTQQLLKKTLRIFEYENLPPTLPSYELERSLIIKGYAGVIKVKGKLYAPFTGNVFGYDEYYRPDRFTYAQPILGSASKKDGDDCAIIWHDSLAGVTGSEGSTLWYTIQRYARMLADVESSLHAQLINARGGRLGVAQNEATSRAVDMVYKKLEYGEITSIINPSSMLDTFQPLPLPDVSNGLMWDFTRLRDYIMNCFLNEIGIKTIEEKRERMITQEVECDEELLENNIMDMYTTRLNNVAWINEVFGTDIKVRLRIKGVM